MRPASLLWVPIVCLLCTSQDRLPRPVEVAFGSDPLQRLDVYSPPSGKAARCVLLVHGGGWHAGNKREWSAQMRRTADVLYLAGLLVASTNYRLAPAHRWPDPVDDVASAIRWIRKEAGCGHLVVVGESAGASVAAAAAWGPTRGMTEAFIGFAGIYDFSALPQGPVYDLARQYLGCDPATCPTAAKASPACIWPRDVPALLVHGDADRAVPLDQSEALAKEHPRTALWRVPGGDHSGPTLLSDALDQAIRHLAGADNSPRDQPHADGAAGG